VLLEGVEVAANGRLRHSQLADKFIERGKAANTDDVDETAASFVILHGFSLPEN
jgi:hypothetical protein